MKGPWERICRVEEVAPDRPVGRIVGESGQDRDRVCVVRTGEEEYIAMLDRCPHRDVALSGGVVTNGVLVCPGHFWCFDIRTGRRTDLPERGTTLYPTRVIDGWVEAILPPVTRHVPMRQWLLARAREER